MTAYRVKLITHDGVASLEIDEDDYILDAAYRAGYDLPYTCLQGFCLTCASQLLRGEVDQSESIRFFPEDRKAGFCLICTAKPRADLCIRTHQKKEMQNHRKKQGLPYPRG